MPYSAPSARLAPIAPAMPGLGCCRSSATPASPGSARIAWQQNSWSLTKPRCRKKAKIQKLWHWPAATANSSPARWNRFLSRSAKSLSCANSRAAPTRKSPKSLHARLAPSCQGWPARAPSCAIPFLSPRPRRPAVPCDQTQTQLHGYLDGELDALSAANFEKHLETCPDCKQILAAEESLHRSIQQAGLYERAPQSLRTSLLGNSKQHSVPGARLSSWRWLAVAAVLLLAVFIGWRQLQSGRGPGNAQLMADSFVDAHLRSLQPGHLTDVQSTDQ